MLDGASRIPKMFARAKELGMPAVGLTDHGVMYGAIPFQLLFFTGFTYVAFLSLFQIPINAAMGRFSPEHVQSLKIIKITIPFFVPSAVRSANAEALNEAIQQSAQAAQQDNNFTNWETQPL